jgi:hypothetical protein
VGATPGAVEVDQEAEEEDDSCNFGFLILDWGSLTRKLRFWIVYAFRQYCDRNGSDNEDCLEFVSIAIIY